MLRFTKNFRDIKEHNKKFDLGLVEYSLDINQFADLTAEEIKKFTFGHQLPPYEFSNYTVRPKVFLQVTSNSGIPAGPTAVDWNSAGAVGPVNLVLYFYLAIKLLIYLKLFRSKIKVIIAIVVGHFPQPPHLKALWQCIRTFCNFKRFLIICFRKYGNMTVGSEQNLIDCNLNNQTGNFGCNGGNVAAA